MRKDILMPEVEDVAIAVVQEEPGLEEYGVYVINMKFVDLENVLVVSEGYGMIQEQNMKTSTLRHFLGTVKQHQYEKIEPIQKEVFALTNEYWLSFYINNQVYDKKYIFLAETLIEDNFVNVPLINKRGVLIL